MPGSNDFRGSTLIRVIWTDSLYVFKKYLICVFFGRKKWCFEAIIEVSPHPFLQNKYCLFYGTVFHPVFLNTKCRRRVQS